MKTAQLLMRGAGMLMVLGFYAGIGLAPTQETMAEESAVVQKPHSRPLLGVQRWDMFSGKGATQQKELGYLPGGPGFLRDSQWHKRSPFFC